MCSALKVLQTTQKTTTETTKGVYIFFIYNGQHCLTYSQTSKTTLKRNEFKSFFNVDATRITTCFWIIHNKKYKVLQHFFICFML